MELTLESIREKGACVGAPVPKTIEWYSKGEKHSADVLIRLSSYETVTREFELQRNGGDVLISRIVAGVVNSKGEPVFSCMEDITGDPVTGDGKLCASLFLALITAVNEANGLTDPEPKNSNPPSPSGTN